MRLLGRDTELADLRLIAATDDARWITVLGLGGVGKTSLVAELVRSSPAFQNVRRLAPELEGFVGPTRLSAAIALASGVDGSGGIERLIGETDWLLVESAEVLTDAETAQLESWLVCYPRLRLLMTSRRRLGASEEYTFTLEPLALPSAGTSVHQSPAVQLLLSGERHGTAEHEPLTETADEELSTLARALGGLPLALELCAPHVALFGAAETLSRLREIVGPPSAATSQPQPVARVLETTWASMPPWVRPALAQLSAFRSSFTLAAVEAIVELPERESGMTLLSTLRDHALLQLVPEDASRRFKLHDLIRVHAEDRRAMSPPSAERALRSRLHDYFVAEIAARPYQRAMRPRLLSEAGDILAACARVVERPQARPQDLAEVGLVVRRMRMAGVPMAQLAPLVSRIAQPEVLHALGPRSEAELSELLGIIRGRSGSEDSEGWLTRAKRGAARAEDPELLFSTLLQLCHQRLELRRLAEVESLVTEMRELLPQLTSPKHVAWVKVLEALAQRDRGNVMWLKSHLIEALRILRDHGFSGASVAWVEARLADLLLDAGQHSEALVHAREVHALLPSTHALVVYALHLEVVACVDDRNGAQRALARLDALAVGNEGTALIAQLSRAIELLRSRSWSAAVTALEALSRSGETWASSPPLALGLVVAYANSGDQRMARALHRQVIADTDPTHRDHTVAALRDHVGAWLEGDETSTPPKFRPTADPVAAAVMRVTVDAMQEGRGAEPLLLRVGRDWAWLNLPNGKQLSLTRRPTLQRLVRVLVAAHAEGSPLSTDALFELGWPDEDIAVGAARNRVRVALSRLRSAGFSGLLERCAQGVSLTNRLRVEHL